MGDDDHNTQKGVTANGQLFGLKWMGDLDGKPRFEPSRSSVQYNRQISSKNLASRSCRNSRLLIGQLVNMLNNNICEYICHHAEMFSRIIIIYII